MRCPHCHTIPAPEQDDGGLGLLGCCPAATYDADDEEQYDMDERLLAFYLSTKDPTDTT